MEYFVKFKAVNEILKLNIHLSDGENLVPVYLRMFERSIIEEKSEFLSVFNSLNAYFNETNINMTKNDLDLFYNTFMKFDISLPTLSNVTIISKDIETKYEVLTPKEILFLCYLHGKSVQAKVAKYFIEEYQLDLDFTIDKLLYYGYLTTEDYRFNVKCATVKELTEVLDKYDLKHKGNKGELIETVLTQLDEEQLSNEFSHKSYKMTELGSKIVKQNENLLEFHKSYYRYANGLNIEEFYLLSKKYIDLDAKDVCKIMVADKNNKSFNHFDWSSLFEEGKRGKLEEEFLEIISRNKGKEMEDKKVETKVSKEIKFDDILSKYGSNIKHKEEKKEEEINQPIEIKEKKVVNDNQDLDDFSKILKKYDAKKNVNIPKITTDEFLEVVYKRLNKEDHLIEKLQDEIKKENKENKETNQYIESNNSLEKYLVKEEIKKVIEEVIQHEEKVILDEQLEIITASKKDSYLRLFIFRYLLTSAISIYIIYYLYTQVFIQEG